MPEFRLDAPFQPTGDQPEAIRRLSEGVAKGLKQQVLLGATGTGKSLAGDEPILIGTQDDHGRIIWSVEPLGPFVDARIQGVGAVVDEWGTQVAHMTPDRPGHVVATVDPLSHATVVRPVTAISRHASPDT